MSSIRHLQRRLEECRKQYNLLSDKIDDLRQAMAIEYNPSLRHQLKYQVQQAETERNELDQQITELELQIETGKGLMQVSDELDLCEWIHLKCDRSDQNSEFSKHFSLAARQGNKSPQVYLIQGDERECHKSLVKRFCITSIKKYAEFKFGEKRVGIPLWKINWPYAEDVIESEKQLLNQLFLKCDPLYEFKSDDYSVPAFCRLLSPMGKHNPLIIIQHDIRIASWKRSDRKLIESYLRFWDEVKVCDSLPEIIIFLNIMYQAAHAAEWLNPLNYIRGVLRKSVYKNCERQLSQIPQSYRGRLSKHTGEHICCVLLPKLPCVKQDDVMKWFDENDIGEGKRLWRQRCRDVVRKSQCKNMQDVESALSNILSDIQKENEERLKLYGR